MATKDEDLKQKIKSAYEMVTSLNIAEDALKLEAFKFALGDFPEAIINKVNNFKEDKVSNQNPSVQAIAKGLGVQEDNVEIVYILSEGELKLNISPSTLPRSGAEAMRELAVLYSVGRKHAGLGESTSFDSLKSTLDDFGRLDKKNFAAVMAGLRPRLSVDGKGADRSLTPKRPADDWAKELVTKYSTIS